MHISTHLLDQPKVTAKDVRQSATAPPASNRLAAAMQVGANARLMFALPNMLRVPRHPPTNAAFVPGLKDGILLVAIAALGIWASPALKRATGISVLRQMKDMLSLWYQHGIDPPSYFELEMWRTRNVANTAACLTRYETKNGVFRALNNQKPRPHVINEMSDKKLFAELCQASGIRHAETLLHITAGGVNWHCRPEALHTDLFVKYHKGMGAQKTEHFTFQGNDVYALADGSTKTLDELIAYLSRRARKADLLVQRYLHNHPSLASMADQSLLTLRVITCHNEKDEPEVTWAMLRLLTKLEPNWKKHARDMEYACPVNLVSGKLGLLTGDSLKTSHMRYSRHPETFEMLEGKQVPLWRESQDLAIAAHRAFPYRELVGWDIAITPDGPVILEGNTNFDVMFLQRVHDMPIGKSRLGELLNFHIQNYMANAALSSRC